MVRLFEVTNLKEQKRLLVVRCEIHRQTLRLELANAQYMVVSIKSRLGIFENFWSILTCAAPVAGWIVANRQSPRKGFLGKIMSGMSLYRQIRKVLAAMRSEDKPAT